MALWPYKFDNHFVIPISSEILNAADKADWVQEGFVPAELWDKIDRIGLILQAYNHSITITDT